MTTFFRHLPFVLILLPLPAFAAAGLQDLDALERRLVIQLRADVGEPGGPTVRLDRRLKLAACPSPVIIDPPQLGAAVLRCAEIGWRIRVPLVRGGNAVPASGNTVPGPAAMRSAPVIRRGDSVDLIAGDPGFTVSSQVVAEQDGAPGDRIRVRGDRSKPAIVAEVVDSSTVRLSGFK